MTGKIHTRSKPITLPADFPSSVPAPTGVRTITIRTQSDVAAIGNWQTVRDLNIARAGLNIDVPPGNYGTFTVNGNSRLNFTTGTYNFANTFNLDGSASLQATGNVNINVAQNLTINSGAVVLGSYTSPGDVRLNVLGSSLNINGSSQVSALVRAHHGTVTLNGNAQVRGQVIANSFTLNGGRVVGAVWPTQTENNLTLFGPRRFDRTTGSPNQYLEQFSLPAGVTSPPKLRIQNGSAGGANRVSSATVKLNGAEILIQSDLNQNVAIIERTVDLSATNSLEVRLTSNPGSYLVINISAETIPEDTTPPSVSITVPAAETETTNTSITVRGTVSDSGSPASGAAHVYVNGLEADLDLSQQAWSISDVPLDLGDNEITVRAIDSAGNESSVSINVTREAPNEAPVVKAGEDQTFALPDEATLLGTATDDGLPDGNTLSFLWSVVSNPGPVVFADPTKLETSASVIVPGTYVLRLTASDGELSNFDEITLTVQPENQPPTVNAGSDQTLALPRVATLNGIVTDDGLPEGSTLSFLWTQVSGPGTTVFEAPQSNETVASFSAPGTYILRLSATDGDLSANSDITIIVHPENMSPTAKAGTDQTISLPSTAQLNGSASDDGWPFESTLSTSWSQVEGPGTTTFESPDATVTNASFSAPGVYLLRLTATDGELTDIDDLFIRVTPPNQAPFVNAGTDQTTTFPDAASLNGEITDDGLPLDSSLSVIWSRVSGPAEVTFTDPHAEITAAQFSAPGNYILRLTASDGALVAFDEITIDIIDPRAPPIADFITPQSSGTVGGFVIASSGAPSSGFSPDRILDNSTSTIWTTNGPTNQFVTIQLFDQQGVYIDRVRLQSEQGSVSPSAVKDFEVQISATTSDAAGFITVLNASYINSGQLQEFVLPGGPARARFIKFLPKNNHGGSGNIQVATFNPVAVGGIDSIISLPGDVNAARSQSPALYDNSGVIHSFSYGGGTNSANGLLGYANGGWITTGTNNEFAIIQLGGEGLHNIRGVKLATWIDSKATAVKDFEVWVSTTSTEPAAFSRVLTASAPYVAPVQTYLIPSGPVSARFIKYVPLNNHGGGTTINTPVFDVVRDSGAGVVEVSAEYEHAPRPAEAAFDGDSNSVWLAPVTAGSHISVKTALADDLLHKVYGFRVLPVNDFGSGQLGPKDFEIRVSTTTSDNSSFHTVHSGTLAGTFGGGFQDVILPDLIDAKHVQFVWKNGYNNFNIGVREIEVLTAPARGSALVAFSSQTEPASNCIDLDPTNQWTTASGQVTNQWIKLLLPRAELSTINHIALRPAIAFNGLFGAPKDFEFQVSATDAADASFSTVLNGTLANSTQLQDFHFAPTPARYVRLLLKNSYSSTRIGLASFYVFSSIDVGSTVHFFDRSGDSDSQVVSWHWDFGDGSSSTEQNPTHAYAEPGSYSVSLTVTDDTGLINTKSTVYRVNASLQGHFTSSSLIAHEGGAPVRFTDVTRGMLQPNALRQYVLGDGGTISQNGFPALYNYADSGEFNVKLKIGDAQGINYDVTRNITVLNLPPAVEIDPGKTIVWGEPVTSVPKISEQSPVDRLSLTGKWDFGDGQSSSCVNCTNTNATVTHAYNYPGTYNAVLTVTDKDGGAGSDSATHVVNKRPTAFIFQTPPAHTNGPLVVHTQLIDSFANAGLSNKAVHLIINGAEFSVVTGANGIAQVTVPLPDGTKIDTIIANFAGDDFYLSGSSVTVPVTADTPPGDGGTSQEGTDFWLMFPHAYTDSAGFAVQSLFISSRVATSGTVHIPSVNFSSAFSIPANGVASVVLPAIQVTESDAVTNKGIHVTSQLPVSVYGLNKRHATSDAFLGLPVDVLGMDHYVLTYSNMSFAPSTEFGVVAAQNNTNITVTPSVTTLNRTAGVPYNITLQQGQTYLLQNTTPNGQADLSGSRILSDKPIAVFAAHSAATIPAEAVCCADHLVEQVPPVNAWGKRFATIPFATRTKGDFLRFIAAEDDTAIYLNGNLAHKLNAGQYVERLVTIKTEIISTKPIMVGQYATSVRFDPSGDADPFLMILPPYSQFLNHYTISTPVTGFSINYANVIAPTALLGAITLDGSPLPVAGFSPIGVSGFSGGQIPLTIGAHTFAGPVGFGVFVYGFNRDEGYGYPGGMNLAATPRSINVAITPQTAAYSINSPACTTATVTDESQNPLGGKTLVFTVTGVHPATSSFETDAAGQARLCYTGANIGTDNLDASVTGASASASILWAPPNSAPTVLAGLDQVVTMPAPVELAGTASDDGLPSNTLIFKWSKVSGPGAVVFTHADNAATGVQFDSPGSYVLRLTVDDGELKTSDELEVIVNPAPPNLAPVVGAGTDLTTTLNGNLVFNGGSDLALVDNRIPGWTEVGSTWHQSAVGVTTQRGVGLFASGDHLQAELRQDVDVSSFASAIAAGTQQFEFKAYLRSAVEPSPDVARVIVEYRDATNTDILATLDSGPITSTADWHLTEDIRTPPQGTGWIRVRLLATRNTGSSTDVSFDSISLRPIGNTAGKLVGFASDDGLPFGSTLSSLWTTVSGPGPVVFAEPSAPQTAAMFTVPGRYVLGLSGSDGALTTTDDVMVVVNPANKPPTVSAGPGQSITLPADASLNGTVVDDTQPQGSTVNVRWTRVSGPGLVTFADAHQVSTTASFSSAGVYVLRLTADDGEYASTSDVTIRVEPAANNQPPTVNAGAGQTISLPVDSVTLHGTVADDGLPFGSTLLITWSVVSGPGNVVFGSPNAAETFAQFSATGTYILRLSASDAEYVASDLVTVNVTPPNQAPLTQAGADQTILLSHKAQLNGAVSDDGLPGGTLTTVWSKVSGPGTVTFDSPHVTVTGARFSAIGSFILRLTASDGALTGTDEITITVIDDVPPPVVEITSPDDGADLSNPTSINGSVSNGNWFLEYSLNSQDGTNAQAWRQLAAGTGPVTNSLLSTLDTTLMLNGLYGVRLRAVDEFGQTASTSIGVVIDGNFKVGHFQIALSDLNVPVGGLPIEVVRSYDTRDKRAGEFGVGWQLGIRSARVEKSGVLGFGWHQTATSGLSPTYCLEPSRPHKVAITFGDGKVFKFRASTAIHCQPLAPITATRLTFTPEPGTHATLESTAATDVVVETLGNIPGPVRLINQSTPDIFNAGTFRLTLPEGIVYVIDQLDGVRSVRDAHGNSLTISAGGIVHSSGQSISFARDLLGRITQVTDPNGHTQHYDYDDRGDLIGHTDRAQNITAYTYNSDHHLVSITDARGVQLLTNQYDGAGRLLGQTDALNKTISYDHDISGRVETITDRLGHQTRYEYDERGNVLRQVNARGGVKTFTYDEFDNLLTETNELGKTTTYTYDAADNRTSITDPLNHVTRFTYNAARQPLTVTDARGNITTNTYDATGTNLLTTTDALGNTTTFTYNAFTGLRTTLKDAMGHITQYSYDAFNRLQTETDPLGNVTTYGYDANGNRTTQTVSRTNAQGVSEAITTTYTYDQLNRLIRTTFADSTFTEVEYNAIGQQAATIDQLGHRTEFTYDEMGRLTRTVYPDGTQEETTYDAEGRRLTTKNRAGRVTAYTYDELGRLTKTSYPDQTSTSTTYDAAGQVLTSTDARGNVTRYFYDDAGRRTNVRNASNQETLFGFDANGNQVSTTDALGRVTGYEYDDNNHRTRTIYADDSFDLVAYDELGRVVSRVDQAGKTTQFRYDALGRLVKVKDALNQETNFTYNELGQQLSQTDANNHTTRFEYDRLGRRVKRVLPGGQFETYSYDAGGNLRQRTDFNGHPTTFAYDAMRRLLSKTPDPSLNQPAIGFTYNVNGQRVTMTDASGTTVYAYDTSDRLAGKQTPFGTLSYTYDEAGNVSSLRSSNANGTSIDYSYDSLNRLASVKDNNLLALNGGVTNYHYDAVGNLQNYVYPNAVTTAYNYNSLNRLISMNASTSISTLSSYTYTLGAAGNRTSVAELGGRKVTYTYDDLYRLTSETITADSHGINGSVSYAYDAVGNRLSRASSLSGISAYNSTYDPNDRLTSDTYDANGNTKINGGNNYTYDFENHLTSLSTEHSSLSTFIYDGDGNRVGKTVNGVTTNYLIDTNNHTGHAQVVEELVGGTVVKQFTYGHDLISQRCALPTANCTLSFYQYDGHGSVRQLTDDAGSISDTYDYDAFGNLIHRTGTTSNDYLYSGEQVDAHLGFYYLRARYMNPSSGRFWTLDTYEGSTSDPNTLHKFTYVNNSPVDLVDPSGHIGVAEIIGHVTSLSLRATVFALYSQRLHATLSLVADAYTVAMLIGGTDEDRHGTIAITGGPAAVASSLAQQTGIIRSVARSTFNIGVATGAATSPAQTARTIQMTSGYGIDKWFNKTLHRGEIYYAGEPYVTGFFTSERTIVRAGGDATKLFEGLQVRPYYGQYRNGVTAFEVLEDCPAAAGIVRANPQYGRGGFPQVYVPNWEQKLRPIVSYPLNNRTAPLPE
ncbi:MAG TPA: PKD domain-containing protein [Pyrinomonadaceae bacterium]|nr:PKD domain-containing protein [Pyrinomonadaceae bacterium]